LCSLRSRYFGHHGTEAPTPTPEDYGDYDYDYDYDTDDYYLPPEQYSDVMDVLTWAVDSGVGDRILPAASFSPLDDHYGRVFVRSRHGVYNESVLCALEYVYKRK
jgi:hypothetical protein